MIARLLFVAFLCSVSGVVAMPRDALPLDAAQWPEQYRLHVEGAAVVKWQEGFSVSLGAAGPHDLAIEYPSSGAPLLRVWRAGKLVRGPEKVPALARSGAMNFPQAKLTLAGDFTSMVRFATKADGTLFARCDPQGKWAPGNKALFIQDGNLVYDIGWLGAISGGPKVNDGKAHTALLVVKAGTARLWLDGKVVAQQKNFTQPDPAATVFKVGRATEDFGGDFAGGTIASVYGWNRALPEQEIASLWKNGVIAANTTDFSYVPKTIDRPTITGDRGWVQPLERSDHREIVAGWNAKSLQQGKVIYESLCITCHGTHEQAGSLPTALRFSQGAFKNGADPYSMYHTLTHGYGQMTAQPQYTTEQKYAVIHYIRETMLKPHNPSQYVKINLLDLPLGLTGGEKEKADTSLPPYQQMELGNALFWTLQLEKDQIAQKAIAVRVDDGPGGVTKGRAWMIYDHDTMNLVAATTGSFVDWKGIAFDGSHGTHTSITGEKHFLNPISPGWSLAGFEETRTAAKDGKCYGPTPGLRYRGLYKYQQRVVIAATIFGTDVLESPSWIDIAETPVFVRTIQVGKSEKPLRLRVAPDHMQVRDTQQKCRLFKEQGFWVAEFSGGEVSRLLIAKMDEAAWQKFVLNDAENLDLVAMTKGGAPQWLATINTTSVAGKSDTPFAVDQFPLPHVNPWQSWLRPGGFDFTPDGKAAIVAMWNGDVWRVDGVMDKAPATLTWRRIASGLFQPLGVKFRGDDLFVTCRDQIACLRDLNGDGETDWIECFNDDAQVTEHFHEFAMGLQTDAAGNFYYAKSGRHALDSVVPQHGTLLKVSADGKTTEIIATGFRAANGVCINDDGSFFVTDQEGFWTPKNRINHVKKGGFYGNMFGYTNVTDSSDEAMEQPMVWITNAKDRSPAELVWVPQQAWGSLGGSLLNLSYGTGRVFVVPHENLDGDWQGAVCELPMPACETGLMRGRFGRDGSLYGCGMFAWAGNATSPGGFERIRRNAAPAYLPLKIQAKVGVLEVRMSDALEGVTLRAEDFQMKAWSLRRSANYGSKHFDERPWRVSGATLSADKKSLILEIPDLALTQSYELVIKFTSAKGEVIERNLHGTIHHLTKGK